MRLLRALASACALLAACCGGGCAPRSARPTAVTFWQPFEAARWDSLVARFERENPGVRVDVRTIPADAMRDSIAAALAGGAVPDLAVLDSTVMPQLLAHGALSDWSAGVADLRDSLVGWELCSVGDALYGMPWLLETRVLYYDRAAFARAKLDPATALASWEGIERAAAKLARAGGGFGCTDAGGVAGIACLLADGALLAPGTSDSLVLDGATATAAWPRWERLRTHARTGTAADLEARFTAGQLGLLLAGKGLASRLGARAGVGMRELPAPDTSRAARTGVGSGWVLTSFARSAHKEPALRFARFLAAPARAAGAAAAFPEFTLASASAAGDPFATQARRDWYPPAASRGDERLRVLADALLEAAGVPARSAMVLAEAQARLDSLREARP